MPKQRTEYSDSRCATYISTALQSFVAVILVHVNYEAGWFDIHHHIDVVIKSTRVQVFSFTVSALVYCDGNTIVSALETLHQLLLYVCAEFEAWLLSTAQQMQVSLFFIYCRYRN